jgi:hypothetical protein
MKERVEKIAFVLLCLNIAMVLLGAFALVWRSSRAASARITPRNVASLAAPGRPVPPSFALPVPRA